MPYSNALRDFSEWYIQLWAESLGKSVNLKGKAVNIGPTPVKAIGTTDQHSQLQLYMEGPYDKIITFIEVKKLTYGMMGKKGYEKKGAEVKEGLRRNKRYVIQG